MVRNYKRKTEKRESDDNLISALRAIENGMSIRAAARQFGLAETTLRRHRSNNKSTDDRAAETATSSTSTSTTSTNAVAQPTPSTSTATEPTQTADAAKAETSLVFPRVRFQDHFLNGGPVGCWGGANPSGFMNSEHFLDFMKRFQQFTRCSIENPIFLLLDNHESHRNLEVITFCRDNGIHVLSFPPHTSHRMQPLDVSVFSPFKTAANQLCKDWVKTHPGRVMSIFDLPPVFARALEIGATEVNIKSGFRKPGIYPFDRQVFQDIDFFPSKTTDRPYTAADLVDEQAIPLAADVELPHNRSQQSIDENDLDVEMEENRPLNTSTSQGSVQDLVNVLEGIKPLPQAPPRKEGPRRGRKPGSTAILTSDESFNEIQEQRQARDDQKKAAEERKAAAAAKKEATTKKKLAAAAKKEATAKKKLAAAAKKAKEKASKRISSRRKTITSTSYAESSSS